MPYIDNKDLNYLIELCEEICFSQLCSRYMEISALIKNGDRSEKTIDEERMVRKALNEYISYKNGRWN